jgi:serine protease Do
VIGVVSAKTVGSGVEGIGFAIPINSAVGIADELIKSGEITGRPLLGITYQETPPDGTGDAPRGVYIAEVAAGGSAERGGMLPGDIVTSFNGERVTMGAELLIALNACRVGDEVQVVVWRGGTEHTLTITLDTARTDAQQPRPAFPWGR